MNPRLRPMPARRVPGPRPRFERSGAEGTSFLKPDVRPTAGISGGQRQTLHGDRLGRQRMRLAVSSPRNSSWAGSHFSGRLSSIARLPRWHSVADRWPTSTLAIGCWRVRLRRKRPKPRGRSCQGCSASGSPQHRPRGPRSPNGTIPLQTVSFAFPFSCMLMFVRTC